MGFLEGVYAGWWQGLHSPLIMGGESIWKNIKCPAFQIIQSSIYSTKVFWAFHYAKKNGTRDKFPAIKKNYGLDGKIGNFSQQTIFV